MYDMLGKTLINYWVLLSKKLFRAIHQSWPFASLLWDKHVLFKAWLVWLSLFFPSSSSSFTGGQQHDFAHSFPRIGPDIIKAREKKASLLLTLPFHFFPLARWKMRIICKFFVSPPLLFRKKAVRQTETSKSAATAEESPPPSSFFSRRPFACRKEPIFFSLENEFSLPLPVPPSLLRL